MYRLSAVAMAASLALSLSASAAKAECGEEVLACESQCPDLEDDMDAGCACYDSCDDDPGEETGKSQRDGALPESRLPESRFPESRMPDSFL